MNSKIFVNTKNGSTVSVPLSKLRSPRAVLLLLIAIWRVHRDSILAQWHKVHPADTMPYGWHRLEKRGNHET